MEIKKEKIKVKKVLAGYYTGRQAFDYNKTKRSDIRLKDLLDKESEIVREFLTQVPSGKILDVACGTGIMFPNYGKHEIYGVDISSDMLAIARKDFPSAKLFKSEAEKLPFPDNYFSATISSRFICHIPNYEKVISEMVRVTKPGGFLILDFFNKLSLTYPTTKIRLMSGDLRYFNLFSYRDVKKIAERYNLEIKSMRSKVLLPPKIFPKFAYKLSRKVNDFLADSMPKISSPMYFLFVKRK